MNKLILLFISILTLVLLPACKKTVQGFKFVNDSNTIDHSIKTHQEMSLDDSKAFAFKQRDFLNTLSEPSYDPYSGKNTVPDPCRQENLPKPTETEDKAQWSFFLSLYSSESKILGNCSSPDKLLKTQILYLYCKQTKGLHIFKFFYDSPKWKTEALAKCD